MTDTAAVSDIEARYGRGSLEVFFAPHSVAVVGASDKPGSVGRTLLSNLNNGSFRGAVFPVNPQRITVQGKKAYPDIRSVPSEVDLAVIATPAVTVPDVIRECANCGVKGAIVISAGFKECGPAGAELEQRILREASRSRLRIIGPNCLGVMCPLTGLNATFAGTMARPGNVAFISQSGALCTAILDWSLREIVGFSAFVSIGSMLDVQWGDLIDYLGEDPRTQSIVMYMESIGEARSFLSAAREVALKKPIIVIKAGRTAAAAKAAASHTGALAGADDVLEAAFRRSGVLRVATIGELFGMAEVLAKQPRPRGPRLTILSNAGGPGVLATDALIERGGELAVLSAETLNALNQLLPPHWSHGNPIDVLGDASAERYGKAVEIAAKDPNSDGLLVILAPQAMTDPTDTAENVKNFAKLEGKPILASWMGGDQVAAGESILSHAGIATFNYPDTAVRAFHNMWRYSYNLRGLYETPLPGTADSQSEESRDAAAAIVEAARRSSRTTLTEVESKKLLAAYGIPTVTTLAAPSEDEAVRAAGSLGYPVAVKLLSETITHKTDVGGVQLDIGEANAVRRAYRTIESSVNEKAGPGNFLGVTVQPMLREAGYEVIIGSSLDPQFGPVLLFGAGGRLVEVFEDRALALPPLTTTLARRMMEQTRIFKALQGVRGRKPVDIAALERLLVRFSYLVSTQRWIREIDINPLLVSERELIALDARVILHGPEMKESDLPQLAIRPYPVQYTWPWTMRDGTPVTIRPIRPEDEPAMVRFHEGLSERSVYLRYFYMFKLSERVAHERLMRICFIDYDRQIALVAERQKAGDSREILGVARITRVHPASEAECAILISDRVQNQGLGSELLRRLVQVAREEKVQRIRAELLPENPAMARVFRKLGFVLRHSVEENVVKAELEL